MAGLTEQQRKTLELSRHISVTANAGSGKTRVLVERYVEAIERAFKVEEILCLTFTEKAALELRQKIVDRINSEFSAKRSNNHDLERLRLLREARRNMLEANISTIHAFCSQVLREFPIEAEIDANFKVLEDFDAASLKEEACEEAIRELLADERPGNRGDRNNAVVHDFLVRVGFNRTLQLLTELLSNREKIEHIKIAGRPLLTDAENLPKHWTNLSKAVLTVIRENIKRKKGDFSSEIEALSDSLSGQTVELGHVLTELKIALSEILTQDGTPRKRGISVEDGRAYSTQDALSLLEITYTALGDLSADSPPADTDEYLQLLKTVMDLYDKSNANYARKKYSMGALDFDDLQILTVRLLKEKETVRNTLSSRFKHIMVDEFQDTNFLQYDIFMSLLDNFSGEAKFFVVGDPKQSIYRFRNAQVEVSKRAEGDLSELQAGASVSLFESFRMNPDIAGFVNEVFEKVMVENRVFETVGLPATNQTGYKPLVARRPDGEQNPIEIFVCRKNRDIDPDYGVEGMAEDAAMTAGELQAIFSASRIRQMIDEGEKVKMVKSGEQPRQVSYGDIAILLRTRSKLTLLEEALTRYSVPYVVSSGIGFYSAQEIFDLTNYLTFLLDNNSDIDLLTVLRSPFFGISENELYRISLCKGNTLFARLRSFAAIRDASVEVKYAMLTLDDEIQLAQRLTIPQLINRILERTGWIGAYRLSPTGDQRIANLRKLLNIAREFEGRGFNNLYDFVERIKYLKDTAREGQAPVDETVDAVKIMTVHAAKGLEFPVVIIPFCDSTSNRSRGLIVNDHVGVLPLIGSEIPPALSLYKKFEDMNEQAEIARLFYVASTRAMDKLILTTVTKKSGGSGGINSFSDIIGKTLDLSAPPSSGSYDFPGGKVLVHTSMPHVEEQVVEKKLKSMKMGKIFLDPIPADIDGEIYSATLLQTFRLCPTKYFLRYRLGMPAPESNVRFDEHAEYDDAILSTVRGELIHSVLQQAVSIGKNDEQELTAIAERTISSMLGNNLVGETKSELVNQIVENARNAIATLNAVAKLDKVFVEQSITRKLGSDFLTGTLDLLTEDEKGYHIFDYKTNRLDKSLDEIYSEYEIQMRLYASLCGSLKSRQNEFDATIIFTREAGKYLTRSYSRKEIEDFEIDLEGMLRKIKAIELPGGFYPSANGDSLPTSTPHCPECEYFIGEQEKECLLKRRRE